jgi:hypothetical protein
MMKVLAITIAVVSALAILCAPADAAKNHRNKHHGAQKTYAAEPQIACTVGGCMPVPRGCHPEMGYTPDGTPTGFDVTVCGNFTLHGNRR